MVMCPAHLGDSRATSAQSMPRPGACGCGYCPRRSRNAIYHSQIASSPREDGTSVSPDTLPDRMGYQAGKKAGGFLGRCSSVALGPQAGS
jgi:hypothetical protein